MEHMKPRSILGNEISFGKEIEMKFSSRQETKRDDKKVEEQEQKRLVTFAEHEQDKENNQMVVVEMQTNGRIREKRMTTEKYKIDNLKDYKYFKEVIQVEKHGSFLEQYKHFESMINQEKRDEAKNKARMLKF